MMTRIDTRPRLPFPRPGVLDPAPMLARLQAAAPVTAVGTAVGDPAWLVTGYAEARALFADPRLGRSHPDPDRAARFSRGVLFAGPMGDAETEPADHARMRRLLAPAFSARRMRALTQHVATLLDGLLTAMLDHGPPADLHEALSFPLPVMVICELLGVPYEDRERFRGWSQGMAGTTDRDAAVAAMGRLVGFMHELVKIKRDRRGEDVVSDLLAAQDREQLTDEAIAGMAAMLLFAGHETTVTRIDFGTLLLLHHRDQFDALRADPGLVDGTVEEILRLASPSSLGGLPRYAHADIDIAGVHIRAGDAVLLSSSTANRDPGVYTDPERFDATRCTTTHLAFGYGPRYCIGASLARVELKAVFAALPRRLPGLHLAVPVQELRLRTDVFTGGLEALPVAW
jgi:cytochrome P450